MPSFIESPGNGATLGRAAGGAVNSLYIRRNQVEGCVRRWATMVADNPESPRTNGTSVVLGCEFYERLTADLSVVERTRRVLDGRDLSVRSASSLATWQRLDARFEDLSLPIFKRAPVTHSSRVRFYEPVPSPHTTRRFSYCRPVRASRDGSTSVHLIRSSGFLSFLVIFHGSVP